MRASRARHAGREAGLGPGPPGLQALSQYRPSAPASKVEPQAPTAFRTVAGNARSGDEISPRAAAPEGPVAPPARPPQRGAPLFKGAHGGSMD